MTKHIHIHVGTKDATTKESFAVGNALGEAQKIIQAAYRAQDTEEQRNVIREIDSLIAKARNLVSRLK